MDGHHFDNLTRRLAARRSRRSVLKLLAGGAAGVLATLSGAVPASAACREAGRRCAQNGHCCSGICDPASMTCACPAGTENCQGACTTPAAYAGDPANCGSCGSRCSVVANATATCAGGACTFNCNPGFILCGGVCQTGACCIDGAAVPAGTICRPASCIEGVLTPAATCDGESGACPPGEPVPCGAYACDAAGVACRTGCGGEADCAAWAHCDEGQCLPDVGLGQACDEGSDCQTGHCVGGICCGVTCPPPPAHAAAVCVGLFGCGFACETGYRSCGGACISANGCCIGGAFVAAGMPNPANQCQACQPAIDATSWSDRPNDSGCDDGDACTRTDTCQGGACTGQDRVVCTPSAACKVATCDPQSGACTETDAPNNSDVGCENGVCCSGVCCTDPDLPPAFLECRIDGTCGTVGEFCPPGTTRCGDECIVQTGSLCCPGETGFGFFTCGTAQCIDGFFVWPCPDQQGPSVCCNTDCCCEYGEGCTWDPPDL